MNVENRERKPVCDERLRTRGRAYWLVSCALVLVLMGSNIPSPLFDIYARHWGFSTAVLTLIFAVYALALIAALLIFGPLSDRIGRRKVILAGLGVAASGSLLFTLAQDTAWLFAARVMQGLAVGIISGAGTAALAELHPRGDRKSAALAASIALTGGVALGPLFGGLFAQYGPSPLVLPYLAHLALLALATREIWRMVPETVEVKSDRSAWRLQRLRVPAEIRRSFALGSAACAAGWGVSGTFLALGPSYTADLLQAQNLALTGGVVFVMLGTAAAAQFLLRQVPYSRAIILGSLALVAGLLGIVLAIPTESLAWLAGGALLGGLGMGLTFMGGLGLVGRVAPGDHRAEVMSGCYVITYLGVGLPVIGVGFAADSIGLTAAVAVFAAIMGSTCLVVACWAWRAPEGRHQVQQHQPRMVGSGSADSWSIRSNALREH
jgi:MFS family permease